MNKLRQDSVGSTKINDTRIAGLYDLEHTIGKGHFAVVKLAKHVFTSEKVAVKVIDKTRLDSISTTHMMQEVRCMKLVQHPNIVRLYEVIDTQTKLFLILELGDYDMYEWLMKRGYDKVGCKEADAQLYFNQIIKAINYCHKLHVVHRDLKPENVVFFEKLGMVKLTDFGFSNFFVPGQQLKTSCGSLAYSAPEILLGDSYDAPAVDVWSLGVILYMLVCGRLPFQESNESETLIRILDCKFSYPEHLSAECRKLISSMLVRDPEKRATLTDILQNKWVREGDLGHAEALPLIFREHLPLSAHETIVEQMVAGQIGSEHQILGAIEQNDYNHLTATYYLLAERVLSCYRLAEANRLMQAAAKELSAIAEANNIGDSSAPVGPLPQHTPAANRSRSRSNSWRGPAPRRAYSILREESEEELSSYLRTSSRQSSRFFNFPPSSLPGTAKSSARGDAASRTSLLMAMSRASSNDSCYIPAGTTAAILEDDVENESPPNSQQDIHNNEYGFATTSSASDLLYSQPTATSTPFTQRLHLAPIHEKMPATSPPTPNPSLSGTSSTYYWSNNGQGHLERYPNYLNLSALPPCSSALTSVGVVNMKQRRNSMSNSLSRRNSSPSVSMFRTNSLHSSRDRISSQAIQEMLEFSRLSGRMRRTASPDSRLSSRSPSPAWSSGRLSPAFPGGIISRLKSSSLTSPSSSAGGGMRKLSSSPHLLGICEEAEEFDLPMNGGHNGQHNQHSSHVVGRHSQLFCNGKSSNNPFALRSTAKKHPQERQHFT